MPLGDYRSRNELSVLEVGGRDGGESLVNAARSLCCDDLARKTFGSHLYPAGLNYSVIL